MPASAEWLFAGLPRELAEALRETGQWAALRCRPWLSPSALRGLQRSLQGCHLRQLDEQYRETEASEECTYSQPLLVPWVELDQDHVISAGQVFRHPDMPKEKLGHLRRVGLQALRQGKVAVALLAGGANLRLASGEPVGCMPRLLQLRSGKSLMQLCCERVRRVASLCCVGPEGLGRSAKPAARASIPVFVMTSRLTHRCVVEHFEANGYFGLPARDVLFFEQQVVPVLDDAGQLLPQSLGGEFAHAPGGPGQALRALASSSALEQMRDRGVECLHILGTENLLARVCDPVFIGFCRDLDIDCACKVTERQDISEDLELFCVRQSPVSTQYADIEDAACGVDPSVAPTELLNLRSGQGTLSYLGSINSVFMAVPYVEEVVDRPIRPHRVNRAVPYLDFHLEHEPELEDLLAASANARPDGLIAAANAADADEAPKKPPLDFGVAPGSWPAEASSPDLACQRALLAAAGEVRALAHNGLDETSAAWRCDVHLDCNGPLAVVRVRTARPGPISLGQSLRGPAGSEVAAVAHVVGTCLRCSLVVPRTPNAWLLETSILDYFAYTDRAIALQVPRASEFAPVRELQGQHTPDSARIAMHILHCTWVSRAGWALTPASMGAFLEGASNAVLEVSPLLSYEGEDLVGRGPVELQLPFHLASAEEFERDMDVAAACCVVSDETGDGLDTRPFYLQEYPRRPEVSCSHAPRFLSASATGTGPRSPRAVAPVDCQVERPDSSAVVNCTTPAWGVEATGHKCELPGL